MNFRTSVVAVIGFGLVILPWEGAVNAVVPLAPAPVVLANADMTADTTIADSLVAVETVAGHLEGVMSTVAQAADDPNFVGVQMTTCRVSIPSSQPDSVYLYQEQALVANLDSPYRQRFLQITPGENHRIDSLTFKPEDSSRWVGLCEQPNPAVLLSDLGEVACSVSLRAAFIGGFVGSTPAEGCAASVRGAVRITNVVVLHETGMDTWDRGFDEQGNRVWGAQDIPYRYRR